MRGRNAFRASQDRSGYSVRQWILLACLILVSLALFGTLLWLSDKAKRELVKLDEVTLCPEPKGGRVLVPELLVALLDPSDELSEAQQEQVNHELERWRSALPKFGRLDIYRTSASSRELVTPVLTICNPGDGSDLSELTGNPTLAHKRWTTEFDAQVRRVLSEAVSGPPAAVSPIFETIQAAAVRTFDLPALDQVAKRRLILVSDLLQNTPDQSHYQGIPDFEAFRHTNYYQQVRAPLRGVDVQILYLARSEAAGLQGMKHVDFWDRYFESLGAVVVEVRRISGMASEDAVRGTQ